MHTHPTWLAVPVGQCGVEHLHVNGADVATYPLLEDVDHEPAVLLRADRTVGDESTLLDIQRPATHAAAPSGIRDGQRLGGSALDDRDVLDEGRPQFIALESVHLSTVV